MTPSEGRVYVNIDGVKRAGSTYREHAHVYAQQLSSVEGLRLRYAGAWGDDEMGQKFAETFLDGLDGLETSAKAAHTRVLYTAEGLNANGEAYATTEENAHKATSRLAVPDDPPPSATPGGPPGASSRGRVNQDPHSAARGGPPAPAQPGRGNTDGRNKDEPAGSGYGRSIPSVYQGLGGTSSSSPAIPAEGTLVASEHFGTPPTLAVDATNTAEGTATPPDHRGTPQTLIGDATHPQEGTLSPSEHFGLPQSAAGEVMSPRDGIAPVEPSTSTMLSAYDGRPELASAHVGGRPLADGEELVALRVTPNGAIAYDANLYDSFLPVSSSSVTGPHGQSIDDDGLRFFVVRPNPHVDPTTAGYQPLTVTFPLPR